MSENQELNQAFNPKCEESTEELLSGDPEIAAFIKEWLGNGMNAYQAYKSLHPDVTDSSARVLGCRKLALVNKTSLAISYGLTYECFFTKLKEGLEATKINSTTGEQESDHAIRKSYLEISAKLLELYK